MAWDGQSGKRSKPLHAHPMSPLQPRHHLYTTDWNTRKKTLPGKLNGAGAWGEFEWD